MKTNKKGFTLVELLVVIAIIGILAAVVLVSLSSQRMKAQESSALQSLRSTTPYAMECVLKGKALAGTPEAGARTSTGPICTGETVPTYPALPGTCLYGKVGDTITLSGCGTGNVYNCVTDTGACTLLDLPALPPR